MAGGYVPLSIWGILHKAFPVCQTEQFLSLAVYKTDAHAVVNHQEGDAVIQFVAQTLKENIHGAVGRIGGDEFAFCYAGELEPERIRHNADKILEILRTQHVNEQTGEVLPVPCSIGIVMSQGDTLDYTQLIRRADLAMYQAKENGKNTFVLNVD